MNSRITEWLKEFKNSWEAKDIGAVLELFSDDVEYWETPFKKLSSKDELRHEWSAILDQENISISTDLFATEGSIYVVKWHLSYEKDQEQSEWAGIYLVELNDEGKCEYFHQTGEKK